MIRIRLVSAGKLAALGVFISIAAALAAYLVVRGKRVESGSVAPKLQGRVVAVFNNTRYAHEVEGQMRFVLTAGVDKTYEDGTHELEHVKLESHGADGARNDMVVADRAKVSDPADLNRLDAEFISNVIVQTTEGLTVKTNYLRYDQMKNVIETKELVEFESDRLSGRSTGLLIEGAYERAHLLKDVDVTIKPASATGGKSGKAASAAREGKKSIESSEDRAARKARKRARKLARKREAGSLEARRKRSDGSRSGKLARGGQKSAAGLGSAKRPTRIQSQSALLEKREHRVTFDGGVTVTQESDEMRASRMIGYIDADSHIERLEARGNSSLTQADRAEVKASDMDFFFGDDQQLQRAVAQGDAQARSLGTASLREVHASMIEAEFVEGATDTITARGNASIRMHATAPATPRDNPTSRELTASVVKLRFHPDGENLSAAEAVENAVMIVTPSRAERGADKKTIRAAQMNALFYDEGNRLKNFKAAGGVRVEIEATVADSHEPRVSTSERLEADFLAESQDVARITQEGSFKYVEGDRNAVAERAVYDGQSEVLNLRGKRPQAWDSKSRTQADEIDYDRKNDETHARGDVRTTYYSRETTNDSTPFKNTKSPIFITASRADARNAEQVAVYTGDARGWQDDSFVKGDRIELYEKDKRMVATGNVESALYRVEREAKPGAKEAVPGFATADRMTYSDAERLVHYDGKVRARQGTDQIHAESVDVYLQKEVNEVERLLAEREVVLLQPGKRGTGDKLVYTANDGRAVLTGKLARVEDVEKGTTMGAELTFYSHDDKIFVDNQHGTGRVRSTHRLTKSRRD
jgi:lipopolysaccharide export system protein LptA